MLRLDTKKGRNGATEEMGKKILVFTGMLALIAGLIAVAFTGLDLNYFEIPSVANGIKRGLDLAGGTIVSYDADTPDAPSTAEMNTVRAMLQERLDALGYTEATLYTAGDRRITIEVPGLTDAEEAVRQIGSTAQLEFRDYTGHTWLTGDMVESARTAYGPVDESGQNSVHYVELAFKSEHQVGDETVFPRDLWSEVTKFAAQQGADEGNNYVAIYMDDKEIFAPRVDPKHASTGLTGDSCVVTFGDSNAAAEARRFASFIRIGGLPFGLIESEARIVGPSLGAEALDRSLTAGFIGLSLLILFMLIYYRLPGLMAAISLLLYTALIAVILATMGVNLSLPGIAGIILSIGMATDANIVIFERIKEELRSGKVVRSAVDSGFKRARTAIIDSNITTMIAGFVLLSFGTGPIKGFATTLLVGVALSMFTALVVTKMLLGQMAGLGVVKLWFYGVREDLTEPKMQTNRFSYVKNFKKFGIPSALVCGFTIVALILPLAGVNLFNLDIDFTGGTSFHYETQTELSNEDTEKIAEIIRDITGQASSAAQRVDTTQVIVKINALDISSETREAVTARLLEEYPELEALNIETVGASVGADLRKAAIWSVVVATILILFYIAIRFHFSSGLASVIAQLHDVAVLLAFYIILQLPINMTFIAVLLTTLGYQINATVILFDRIRENKKRMQRTAFSEIIDRSIKQTLSRNINTTLTTLLPVICIIILGVQSVRVFAIPIAIGLVVGAYSSITLSGSLWHMISAADDKATKKLEEKIQ
jgi:SecD/SecF fusion protein